MFTGIIREVGTVVDVAPDGDLVRLRIRGPQVAGGAAHGDSICTSGVCLTVTTLAGDGTFSTEVMGETLRRTTLGGVQVGDAVNLEPAAQLHTRLDGHIVQGHVDGVGTVLARSPADKWDVVRCALPAELAPLVAEKGSVALDGVSLTVSAVSAASDATQWCEVSLIPVTLAETTLGQLDTGVTVNVETDVIAKQIARLAEFSRCTTMHN